MASVCLHRACFAGIVPASAQVSIVCVSVFESAGEGGSGECFIRAGAVCDISNFSDRFFVYRGNVLTSFLAFFQWIHIDAVEIGGAFGVALLLRKE